MPEQKIVIISHDYDGCFSIMTNEGLKVELSRTKEEYWQKWIEWVRRHEGEVNVEKRFKLIRKQHHAFLDKITKDATEVRVYVGSDRQSYEIDQHNLKKNNNGSVFSALEGLCARRSTSEQPWVFEPLLLADPKIGGYAPFLRRRGEAYKQIKEHSGTYLRVVEEKITFEDDKGRIQNSKRPLLLNQMWDAYRQNPDTPLEFHFIDDRKDLIYDILENLQPKDLPPKMTLVVSKFNYIEMMEKKPDAHKELGRITAVPEKKHDAEKYPYLTWGLYALTAATTIGVAAYAMASTSTLSK